MSNLYRKAEFICNAHTLAQLPEDTFLEVAFAGRSNAGKSSAINTITDQKRLARTSKTPGRTQQIVFFSLDETRYLVDLPGYGFAKVPLSVKQHWEKVLERYLQERQGLRGLVLMMDIRHPLTPFDLKMLQWCQHSDMPTHILLTKADKLSHGKACNVLQQVSKELKKLNYNASVQTFSSLKKQGINEAKVVLNQWLDLEA